MPARAVAHVRSVPPCRQIFRGITIDAMKILLTRLSPDRHRLEIVRRNGTRERIELETRSLLLHDLVHFAVESLAGAQDGFWGSLASGKTFGDLDDRTGVRMADAGPGLRVIEPIVGALQSLANGNPPPPGIVATLREYLPLQGLAVPGWFDDEFVQRVAEKLRQLVGHWRGTPFGKSMELCWEEP